MLEKLNAWHRLECVIEWAGMTTNFFARHIGLARGENLYQIKKGNNGISQKTTALITKAFPEVNPLWLLTGDGEMLQDTEHVGSSKPFYNVGVEQNIRNIDSLTPAQSLVLPHGIDYDLAILYLGKAMGERTPTNSIVLLKKIMPEMIIPGDECVIVTKKIVLLRIAKIENSQSGEPLVRLVAVNNEYYGDVCVSFDEIESVYVVKGEILTNI